MEFGIGMEIDNKATINAFAVDDFVKGLAEYIRTRNYGADIENFTIGLVVIRSKPGYEGWFKERKPRFQKLQKLRDFDQSIMELHNCYSYDIKLSDDEINEFISSKESAIRLFCKKFISSLSNFESPSMKKRDFNLPAFREDVQKFIKSWKVS